MVRLLPLCLALLGAFGEHSPPQPGGTCDEEAQDEFSTLQVASKLQPIASEEVQKRDDTERMKKKEDEDNEDEQGEDEEDEAGEDEDKEDVEAVAALQTASRRRRGGPNAGDFAGRLVRRRRTPAHRRRVAALQTESRQENPDIQDDVIFLDEIEDNFGTYMRALREFQSNRELLTRQDKQAMVNKLREWAVAEADEMINLSDLVAVNEAELEGEEDDEEAAGEEDDDDDKAASKKDSNTDQETTFEMPAPTSEMAPNYPDGTLLQVDVASGRRRFLTRRRDDPDRRRWTARTLGCGDVRRRCTGFGDEKAHLPRGR